MRVYDYDKALAVDKGQDMDDKNGRRAFHGRRAFQGNNWCFYDEVKAEAAAPGVERRVLAYCDELMCVENVFRAGAIGAMHHHPHTQITYVAKGRFRFTIGEVTKEVKAGDTLLKQNGIMHGCECLEDGVLVDFFTPMREDFISNDADNN